MIATHRGHEFQFLPGRTHPQYSIDTFLADEKAFREQYWDVKPGDVVVDAGASYGAYALSASAAGALTVHAFEPERSVYVDLAQNIIANGWSASCLAHNRGLWDANEWVDMGTYAPHWPAQTISGTYEMVRLDDAVRLPHLDWFKLDVEGAEVHALRGAMDTLTRFKPRVIVECHVFLDPNLLPQCKALLTMAGITGLEEIPRNNGECVMLVSK